MSSPSSLALELSTPHRDFVTEKWHAYKERGHFGFHEDNELANSKPIPPAKSVNMPTGITAETFGDIAMIADFVHSFRELLVPRETLHISIGEKYNNLPILRTEVQQLQYPLFQFIV